HVTEAAVQSLAAVHMLEVQLEIHQWWKPQENSWKAASALVSKQCYQQCLDELERLTVVVLENKRNRFARWPHVNLALSLTRATIFCALEQYNAAAAALPPPCPSLSWEEVVEYAFLADFDLLCDCCEDI
ncbi:hypothetical protein BDQ12DRAFT_613636, partial [Crucibulum laeve]